MLKNKKRLLPLIILIIIVVIIMFYKRKSKNQIQSKQIVENRMIRSPSVTSGLNYVVPPQPKAQLKIQAKFELQLDRLLDLQRRKIFPMFESDVMLSANIMLDHHYVDIVELLESTVPDYKTETFKYMLRMKNFMEMRSVNSITPPLEIDQIYVLLLNIIINKIPGDIVEMGVWKGGVSMFMKAVVSFYQNKFEPSKQRDHWLFDNFDVHPPPTSLNSKDLMAHKVNSYMYDKKLDLSKIKEEFADLQLFDSSVKFQAGLFTDTIPSLSPNDLTEIAFLRIDVDYYDSVLYCLELLYFRISKHGVILIDDYNNSFVGCKDAVDFFRAKYEITIPIIDKYKGAVFWRV